MYLTIKNFKCIEELSVYLPIGKSTYISGDSGSGKTTIFVALAWLLYGRDSSSTVSWNHSRGEVPCVMLKSTEMTLFRQKGSELCYQTSRGTVYGDVAQAEVIKEYGTYEFFACSTYVCQGRIHPLVEATPKKRLEYILSLLSASNLSGMVDKLTLMQREKDNVIRSESSAYQASLSLYTTRYSHVREDWFLTQARKSDIESEVLSNSSKLHFLTTELRMTEEKESQYKLLGDLIADKEDRLRLLSEYNTTDLATFKDRRARFKDYCSFIKEKEEISTIVGVLVAERDELGLIDGVEMNVTEEDVTKASMEEGKYKEGKSLADSVPIDYDPTLIESKIVELTCIVKEQSEVAMVKIRREYESERDRVASKLPPQPKRSRYSLVLDRDELEKKEKTEANNIRQEKDRIVQLLQIEHESLVSTYSSTMSAKRSELESAHHSTRNSLLEEQRTMVLGYNNSLKLIEAEIVSLEASREVKSCPKCKCSIRIVGDSLVLSSESTFDNTKYELLTDRRGRIVEALSTVNSSIEDKILRADKAYSECVREKDTEYANTVGKIEREYRLKMERVALEFDGKLKALTDSYSRKCSELLSELGVYETIESTKLLLADLDTKLATLSHVNVNAPEISGRELAEIKRKFNILTKITYQREPPVPPVILRKYMRRSALERELSVVTKKLSQLVPVDREVDTDVDLDSYEICLREKLSLEEGRDELRKKMSELPSSRGLYTVKDELESTRIRLTQLHRTLQMSVTADEAKSERDRLIELKSRVDKNCQLLMKMNELRHDIDASLSEAMHNITEKVNNIISYAVGEVFSDPISLQVTTTKTLKTTGIERPSIGLAIVYRGGNLSDPRDLSYGECVRISTILSLAFARYSGRKLMILDEAAANLDADNEDTMLRVVRKFLPDATLLITCHNSHTGNYDNIIDLNGKLVLPP